MCIDATRKYPEELSGKGKKESKLENKQVVIEEIKKTNEDIKELNFVGKNGSILFVSFEKTEQEQVKKLANSLADLQGISAVKMIVFFDKEVNINDLPSSVWLLTNNIDPKRDSYFHENATNRFVAIDATRKTAKNDSFERDWPNIIVSDKETIKSIDEKWASLGIGDFIASPSNYYKPLIMNEGAVVKNN
jgi:4-hydroxy-3-polyprenylbenzoate decarboxylase